MKMEIRTSPVKFKFNNVDVTWLLATVDAHFSLVSSVAAASSVQKQQLVMSCYPSLRKLNSDNEGFEKYCIITNSISLFLHRRYKHLLIVFHCFSIADRSTRLAQFGRAQDF
jgi:hypothetical protein